MKILKIFIISLVLFFSLFISACGQDLNIELQPKLSEVRYNLFEVKNQEIVINFTSGFREDPYILNGKSENKKEFGVLAVKFYIDISKFKNLPFFKLKIDNQNFEGEFELNPINNTYVQDIETFIDDEIKIDVEVLWEDFNFKDDLINVSKDFKINHKQAFKIFIKEFSSDIKKFLRSNIDFEIYIKIINDNEQNLANTFFYVCLITNNGETFSCIIDPNTSQILSKNSKQNQIIL